MENNQLANFQNSQQVSESLTQQHKIATYVSLAFERTGTNPFNIESMVNDIQSEFPHLNESSLKQAIRNGSLGHYGKTYKLTTQEICIWIREYLKENKKQSPI
jgi:hypothetical protein